ncbi:uncharacterized protein [Temnothorax longispinosus]|uniref:uncharacterized protein isoform X2 n=1 Tax=Temnothorax longispinosus TaxID=300112 RepID=UPI003A98FF7B
MTKQAGQNAKKKQIENVSDENSSDTDEELDKYPRKKSKKGENGSNVKKRKIQPPQFPTFGSLPDVDVNKTTRNVKVSSKRSSDVDVNKTTRNIEVSSKRSSDVDVNKTTRKGTSTERRISNKPGQIVENKRGKENIALNDQRDQSGIVKNKRGKENIALNDQHGQSDETFEEVSMTEFVSRINSTVEKSKTGTGNIGLKGCATSTPNKNGTLKPSCSKTVEENANNDEIPVSREDDFDFHDDQEKDMSDGTYEPHMDTDRGSSDSSSEADENRSLENITEEEEPNEDDPVQTNTAADGRTGVIAILKHMYEKTKKIERRQENLENNIEEIKQLLLSRTETLTHPKDLPKLPLQAYADSKHLEEKINREESQKDYVIKRLCLAARGTSDKECAKRVMEKLMSNHVGTFYSWQGSGGKKDSFKNTVMMETVRLAIKKLRHDVDMGTAEDAIKDWLKSRKFAKNNAIRNIE